MTADEAGVLDVLDRFAHGLAARDLEASMAALDESADDLTVIPSEGVDVHRGPDAVRSFLRRIYAGPRRYRWEWAERLVSVTGDAASFVAVGDEIVEEGESVERIPYCLTGVAYRRGNAWLLRLLHGSEDATRATIDVGTAAR
jgi:SnoaL-like domain